MASRCWITGHTEISALNDPIISSDNNRSKIAQIHVTTTSGSEFHLASLYSRGFRVTGHSETTALNDPKMALNTNPPNVTTAPESQISLFSSYGQPFSSNRPFWDNIVRNVHTMTFDTKMSKVPLYGLLLLAVSNFTCFAVHPPIFKLQTILRQLHWMTPNDLEHLKSKYPIQ